MKKRLVFIFLLISIGFLFGKSFHVENFTSDIYVKKDGTLEVKEKFVYILEGGPFRWIRREALPPRSGFNSLTECRVDGQVMSITDEVGGISSKLSKKLDVKYHMDKAYDKKVVFEIDYIVGNAITEKGGKAVLDWKTLKLEKQFLIKKGTIKLHFPEEINMFDVVNFSDEKKGLTIFEEGNTAIYKLDNFKRKQIVITAHLPLEQMNLVNYAVPEHLLKQYQKDPQMMKYHKGYKVLALLVCLYFLGITIILIIKSVKFNKSLPTCTKLPDEDNPAIVARLIQTGSNELNIISVLMKMAIKNIITFTQIEKKNGKKIKDYWIDINPETVSTDKLDLAYCEMLRKEEKRKNKRVELKTLMNNSYRYKKEVLAVVNPAFEQHAYIDNSKKKSFYWRIGIFFGLILATVAAAITGALLFSATRLFSPIPAYLIAISWISMIPYIDEKQILTQSGLSKYMDWKSYFRYMNKSLATKKSNLSPDNAEQVFPYILTMGLGQQYLQYFKKRNIDLKFPNLGEVAADLEALSTLITVVVVSNASMTGGAAGGSGGTGAG